MVEFNEGAKDDALIVGPNGPAVVGTVLQPIVDEILRVDHSRLLEPCPLVLSDVEIVLFVAHPVGKVRCNTQIQFVRDSVDVCVSFIPPDA